MHAKFFIHHRCVFLIKTSLYIVLILLSYFGFYNQTSAHHNSEPYCTAGSEDDFSDRDCKWNSATASWGCVTSHEGCTVSRHGCGTSSCSVSVTYYCLPQTDGCREESEIRRTSCTNDCDDDPAPPDDDEDEDDDPPPSSSSATIRVQKTGSGSGTVRGIPNVGSTQYIINCGSTCQYVRSGATAGAYLQAIPSGGSTFAGWSVAGGHQTGTLQYSCTNSDPYCRVYASQGATTTATATFNAPPPPTLTGTLTANPTTGTTDTTFTFTATRTGGTATGTVTYRSPSCVGGGVLGGYSGTSDRTFTCKYSSPGGGLFDSRGARMTINQGGVSTTVSRGVTVNAGSATTFGVTLDASPLNGQLGATAFTFTPTAHNIPSAFPSYNLSYQNPSCGQAGVSPTNFSSSTGVFSCMYPASAGAGFKTASVTGRATALFRTTLEDTGTATVTLVAQNAPSVNLTADDTNIDYGDSTTLRWNTNNVTSCTASGGWGGSKSPSGGSQGTGSLTSSRTYTLTCSGPGGSGNSSVTVNVGAEPPPAENVTLSFIALQSAIERPNDTSTLRWVVEHATSCIASSSPSISSWSGAKSSSDGSHTQAVSPINSTTQFTIRCTGDGNPSERTVTVTVTNPTILPGDIEVTPNPTWVPKGGSSTIGLEVTDHTTDDTTCTFSGGGVNETFDYTGPTTRIVTGIDSVTRFSLECSNPGTPSATNSADVYVLPTYGEF